MLCSQSRSQPACFSGRILPTLPLIHRPLQSPSLKKALKLLVAAEQRSAQEEAEVLRTAAAELRSKLASFDSTSFNGQQRKQSQDDDEADAAAKEKLAAPLARKISSKEELLDESQSVTRTDAELLLDMEAFESSEGGDEDTRWQEELFEWALQIMEAEQVTGKQLLQLVTGMRRAVTAAGEPQRTAWLNHRAVTAAFAAVKELLYSTEDQTLVGLAVEFGRLGHQKQRAAILASMFDEIYVRQEKGLAVSHQWQMQLLEVISGLPFMRGASQVARLIIGGLDLEQASPRELHIVLQALMVSRSQKQMAELFLQAVMLSFGKLDDLSPEHLCCLITATSQTDYHLPYRKLQRLAELLVSKDPDLESAPALTKLLDGCMTLGLQHRGLSDAIAAALSTRMAEQSADSTLLVLHALANSRASLGEACRADLAAALKTKFSDMQLEVSHATSGNFTMLIRAMTLLKITPPLSWVDAASTDLVDRIVHLLLDQGDPTMIESPAISEAASCFLCLGYMKPSLTFTGRLFPAIISALPQASVCNLAVIARGACRLAIVVPVPPELWEALDASAADNAATFSDLQFCQVVHSFAKWRRKPVKLSSLIGDQIMERHARLDLHKTSVLLWSLAMLSLQEEDLAVQALSERTGILLDLQAYQQGQSHTVDASNIAWAITTLSPQPVSLAPLISKIMLHARPIQTMTGISMAIMLWACSQCRANPYMLPLYVARIEEVAQDLEPLQITTILYSLGRLNHHPGIELMEALLSAINLNINAFATQGIGQALWACGRLKHHPGVLTGTVLMDIRRRGAEYALEDWTVIVWALTNVGHNTKEYLQLAHHMIEEARLETDLKLLSTILWSAAVFELFDEPVYKRLTQLLSNYRHASYDTESVRRVQEAHLLSCLTGSSKPSDLHPSFRMPGGVQQWMAELMWQDVGPHTRQQYGRIREALDRLNIPAIGNYKLVSKDATLQGRGLRESIMLKRPHGTSRMVAMELLSPNMLTVNTHQPLWRAVYRAACLCALGFDVIWLPYSEWEAALARHLEEEYLLSRISALLSGSKARKEDREEQHLQMMPLSNKHLV